MFFPAKDRGRRPAGSARCQASFPARRTFATLLFLGFCLLPNAALACRYNVRDVGFVDLATEPYRLFAFVRNDTPAEAVAAFAELAPAALRDSNVEFELVNADQRPDHAALKYLTNAPRPESPVGVLVSPDGQSLPLPLVRTGEPASQTVGGVLEEIVASPKREEIVRHASETFAVVLLIDGPDAAENDRASRAITAALDQIRVDMKTMPKAIAQPPVLARLAREAFAQERILLWSLGLRADSVTQARAAIIYGRARWMGPLMKGEEISERNLGRLLAVIGVDCECGLDLSWTLGTPLAIRWDEPRNAAAANSLGFDPENPMVKTEVSRIVSRRYSTLGEERRPGAAVATQDRSAQPESRPRSGRASSEPPPPPSFLGVLLIAAGVMIGLALAAGLLLVLRNARKGPPA